MEYEKIKILSAEEFRRLTGITLEIFEERADMLNKIKGILLGDKGFISAEWGEILCRHGIDLQTPLRDNMVETRPKKEVKALMKIRRKIETAIGILSEHFAIAKIKSRDLW